MASREVHVRHPVDVVTAPFCQIAAGSSGSRAIPDAELQYDAAEKLSARSMTAATCRLFGGSAAFCTAARSVIGDAASRPVNGLDRVNVRIRSPAPVMPSPGS